MMLCLLSAALFFVAASCLKIQAPMTSQSSLTKGENYGHPDWLDDCENIYLDVGTNIGVQIRKLFEPHKYANASVLQIFTDEFGEARQRRTTVCALGMEPNPHHSERLHMLEEAYNKRGFRTHIYPFAAWKEDGNITFHTDMGDFDHERDVANSQNEEWGGHVPILVEDEMKVRAVDLSAFIKSLPQGKIKLMKMDIEGAEYETLARAIPEHIMCKSVIPKLHMEAHWWGNTETWQDDRGIEAIRHHIISQECPQSSHTELLDLDDESFIHDVDDNFSQ